jgi:ADP-ribose pyrophosphatase YjhB (NUDIX family)
MEKINEITSQEERNKVTPECYLYLEENWKILLGCRKNTQFEDWKYNPVAWHVEKWEDALSAVIREAKEEANIILEKENVKLVYTMYKLFPGEEKISFFFKADSYSW